MLLLELKLEMFVDELLSAEAFEKYYCAVSTNRVGKTTKIVLFQSQFGTFMLPCLVLSYMCVGCLTGRVALPGKPLGHDRL